MTQVGVIGLGVMGSPIARHLLARGHALTIYDIVPERVKALEDQGAQGADSPRGVGERSQLALVVVVDDAQVEEVCLGPRGLVEGMASGSTIAICSTVLPRTCQKVASRAQEKGVHVLDTPMVRGAQAAQEGKLLLMVGGDPQVLERHREPLSAFASDIYHLGPVGAGQVGKMVNNLLLWACLMATYEGMTLARALGVDPRRLRQALLQSSGDNWPLRQWERVCQQSTWWDQKDLDGVLALSESVGVATPLSALVKELLKGLGPQKARGLF